MLSLIVVLSHDRKKIYIFRAFRCRFIFIVERSNWQNEINWHCHLRRRKFRIIVCQCSFVDFTFISKIYFENSMFSIVFFSFSNVFSSFSNDFFAFKFSNVEFNLSSIQFVSSTINWSFIYSRRFSKRKTIHFLNEFEIYHFHTDARICLIFVFEWHYFFWWNCRSHNFRQFDLTFFFFSQTTTIFCILKRNFM